MSGGIEGGGTGSGPHGAWTRRDFLRRMGALGAFAAVPAVLAACGNSDSGGSASGTESTSASGTSTPSSAGSASATSAGSGEPIKIGLLVPLSGTYSTLGRDMQNGFQLYLDNNDGMLGGRKVELVTGETEANPEVGLRAARRLIEEDQVAMVTGIVSSAVALGVRDMFDESKIPLIISNAGANDLTRAKKSKYIYRTSFSNWQPAFSVGQWAVDNLDVEGMYLIAPDYAAGREDTVAFRESYEEAGGKTITAEAFPPFGTTQDYQPFISEIQRSGAGGVFSFFSGGEAINFVQQYEQFGLKDSIPLIGPGFLTDEGVLEAQGQSALGIRTSLHYTPLLDNPTNTAFKSAYEEKFDSAVTVFSVQSYDAAQLIDLALQGTDGDTSDPEKLVAAFEGAGELDSPRGKFTVDPDTHNPNQKMYLREVQEVDGALGNVVLEDLGEFKDPG